jgi:hypothetical protein
MAITNSASMPRWLTALRRPPSKAVEGRHPSAIDSA